MRKGQKTVGPALSIGRGSIAVGSPPGRTTIATNNGNQHIISSISSAASVASSRAGSHLGGSRPPVDQRGLPTACQLRVCVRAEALQRAVLPALGARWPRHDPSAQLPGLGRTLIVGWLVGCWLHLVSVMMMDRDPTINQRNKIGLPSINNSANIAMIRKNNPHPNKKPGSPTTIHIKPHTHTHAYIINYRKMSLQKARRKEQSNENTRGISRK